MQAGKCQICLRRLRLKISGEVAKHHVAGDPCPGAGFAPIELDDERLAQMAEIEQRRADALAFDIRNQIERRANRIEPELMRRFAEASCRARKLSARLCRLASWPERFKRQMETYGYGEPPPAYIAARHAAKTEYEEA